jgi:hypothetical protein
MVMVSDARHTGVHVYGSEDGPTDSFKELDKVKLMSMGTLTIASRYNAGTPRICNLGTLTDLEQCEN